MAAAIIPAIQLGISAYSAYKQHKANKEAQQKIEQSRAALVNQAPGFQQKDRQLTQIGLPLLQTTSNYYRALVGGDRGAIDSALAPDRAALQESYAGASKGLDRLQGPTRDLAQAEMARSRAGAMGLLPAQARAGAVEGAQRAGEYATSTGLQAGSRGASLYESAAGIANDAGRLQLAQGQQSGEQGKAMGGLIGEVLRGVLNRNQGGGQTPLPTTGWTPPLSPYPASIYGRG